tara:strand:- start:621 stop:1763 length:1143 start_codon:yes stop_codon:yes gene_type:complete
MAAYTTIDNSEAAFQAFTYTGTGVTGSTLARTFDGSVNLKPGLFYQVRTETDGYRTNIMENEYTGAGVHWLSSSGDAKGSSYSGGTKENLESFDTNGFTHATTNQGSYYHNQDGDGYVVWAWAESGASNATNNDGTITSTVRVNANVGLSFVNWTGTSADGTIGHGLGERPKAIWMYPIQVAANNGNTQRQWWWEANSDGYAISNGLNESQTAERNNLNGLVTADKSGEGTSTVFSVKEQNSSYEGVNHSSQNYLAICWKEIQGFSKFGSYIGNGIDNGPFVFCGFKPALVMIRVMDRAEGTFCYDDARNPVNDDTSYIIGVNDNQANLADTNTRFDFLSNGFKIRDNGPARNTSGSKYAFMAWARNPFVTSTGIPTVAR